MDKSELSDFVLGQIGRYIQMVKPAIDSGDYARAFVEMEAVAGALGLHKKDMLLYVPKSWNFVLTAERLCRELQDAERTPTALESFDAYAAQMKMRLEHS